MMLSGRRLIEVLPLSDLYTVYSNHKRLKVFVEKGRECVICDKEGVLLLVTVEMNGARHVDLYTENFELMTVDHIVPKKQGRMMGWVKSQIEALSNKQPMCVYCNSHKGHSLVSNEEFREQRLANGPLPKKTGEGAIWELVGNSNIFNRSLDNVKVH